MTEPTQTPPPALVTAVAKHAYAESCRHEPDAPDWDSAPQWAVAAYMNATALFLGALFTLATTRQEWGIKFSGLPEWGYTSEQAARDEAERLTLPSDTTPATILTRLVIKTPEETL